MEKLTHCLICGAQLTGNIYLSAQNRFATDQTFIIEKCNNCTFLFTNPRPDAREIHEHYESEEYISHTDRKSSPHEFLYHYTRKLMLKKKVNLLKQYSKGSNEYLLDYGCGTGSFLQAAQKAGYVSTGYEPDKGARNMATQKGVYVESTKNKIFELCNDRFDVVTLWHVLEHLHEFPKILDDFYRIIKSKGLLVVAIPMANSADALYFKKQWAALDLPRHLYHFTPETITASCTKAGFKLIKRKGMPFDSFYISLLSQNERNAKIISIINAFAIGCMSNFKAIMNKNPWSSEIYIFSK